MNRPGWQLPNWLASRITDPGGMILRRALRVAVMVPLIFWVIEIPLGMQGSALPAAFAAFTILAFADLGGPTWDRFRANLLLGAAGVTLVAAGSLVAEVGWLAVTSTLVVVFAISFTSVLRGYFAASSVAILVPWVFAATSPPDLDIIPSRCLGWAMGAVIAAAAAVLLWPAHPRSALRARLAGTMDAAADLVDELITNPLGESSQRAWHRVWTAITEAHLAYDGRLVRPGVGTSRDRSLMLAFDELHRLRTVLHSWLDSADESPLPARDIRLGRITSSTLRASAQALRTGYGVTGALELDLAREKNQDALVAWASDTAARLDPAEFRVRTAATFNVRVAAMVTQVLAVYVQGSLDSRDRTVGRRAAKAQQVTVRFGGEVVIDPGRRTPARELVAAQLSWSSPWFRTAVRTAVALAITVLAVQLTGADHGFWVSLGALVALKLDASGTRRTAASVLAGTVVGFLIASSLVLLVGPDPWVYWSLLPLTAFLAAFAPTAISLAVGQCSFTVFLLTLYGIILPGTVSTGVSRLLDVSLGLAISLMVSVLAWPGGIVPMVVRTLRAAGAASGHALVAAYARLVEGPIAQTGLDSAQAEASRTLAIATESFDLALTQGGTHQLQEVPIWTTVVNSTAQIAFAGEVVAILELVSPLPLDSRSGDAMLAMAHHVQADLIRSTAQLGSDTPLPTQDGRSSSTELARLHQLVDADLATLWQRPGTDCGLAALVLVFAESWLAHCMWLARRLSSRVAGSPEDLGR